jgi:hypothetical protein
MGPATADVSLSAGEKIVATPEKDGLAWPDELSTYATPAPQPMVRLPVRFLRINDTLIWAAPVELFCEMAIAVRNSSPFAHTFYFGYTNGWFGYLPTAGAFAEGGYEPKTSPFTPQAENDLLREVVTYINGIKR